MTTWPGPHGGKAILFTSTDSRVSLSDIFYSVGFGKGLEIRALQNAPQNSDQPSSWPPYLRWKL